MPMGLRDRHAGWGLERVNGDRARHQPRRRRHGLEGGAKQARSIDRIREALRVLRIDAGAEAGESSRGLNLERELAGGLRRDRHLDLDDRLGELVEGGEEPSLKQRHGGELEVRRHLRAGEGYAAFVLRYRLDDVRYLGEHLEPRTSQLPRGLNRRSVECRLPLRDGQRQLEHHLWKRYGEKIATDLTSESHRYPPSGTSASNPFESPGREAAWTGTCIARDWVNAR